MPDKVLSLSGFGGINRKVSPSLVKPSELLMALNVNSDEIGAKKKRQGWVQFLDRADTNSVNTLIPFTNSAGTRYILRQSGLKFYYSTTGTGTWTDCTPTSAPTVSTPHTATSLEGTLFVSNGTDNPWTATAPTTAGSWATNSTAPKAKTVTTWRSRVYASNVPSNEPRVYFSAVSDCTTASTDGWSAGAGAGSLDVESHVKRLAVAGDRVTIFTEDRIHRWDGYARVTIPASSGTNLAESIALGDDELFFLNPFGVYSYTGGRPQIISQKIEDIIHKATFATISPGVFWRNKYYAYITSTALNERTYSNCVLVFDTLLREWYLYSFPKVITSMTTWSSSVTASEELIMGTSDGFTYKLSKEGTEVNDAGTAIEVEITTHPIGVGSFFYNNYKRSYFYTAPGSSATAYYSLDEGDFKNLGDLKDKFKKHHFPANSVARSLKLKVTDNSIAKFILRGIDIIYEPKGER